MILKNAISTTGFTQLLTSHTQKQLSLHATCIHVQYMYMYIHPTLAERVGKS